MMKFREALSLILLALVPLHAFLVTSITRVVAGSHQAPIVWLALWKEALLILIVSIAVMEIISRRDRLKRSFRFDVLDWLIVTLVLLALFVTFTIGTNITQALYGAKYDFTAILSFFVLKRVEWSTAFLEKALRVILGSTVIVVLFGLVTYTLPQSFFTWLGYSDLHSLYVADGPIAAFQYLPNGWRRLQSTLSGPNHLGIWLLLPWSIVLTALLKTPKKIGLWILLLLIDVSLFLTFSRSAWIAATLLFLIVALIFVRKRGLTFSKATLGFTLAGILAAMCIVGYFNREILFRSLSTRHHLERPIAALHTMMQYPLGLGLGSAGPASNRISDTCVFLEAGSDFRWASDRPNLCVFVDDVQMQPTDRACDCPLLPENWYLQIGVELGWIGFFLYLAFTFFTFLRVRKSLPIFLVFLGVSVAALFLHAWEDGAITYSVWLLSAAFFPLALPDHPKDHHA